MNSPWFTVVSSRPSPLSPIRLPNSQPHLAYWPRVHPILFSLLETLAAVILELSEHNSQSTTICSPRRSVRAMGDWLVMHDSETTTKRHSRARLCSAGILISIDTEQYTVERQSRPLSGTDLTLMRNRMDDQYFILVTFY